MISCDCTPYDINDMGDSWCEHTVIRKARKTHTCYECDEPILPGQYYEYTSGVWDGTPDSFKVCLVCREIQKQYCPGGSFFGHLRYHIQKCLGFDYTKVPTDD